MSVILSFLVDFVFPRFCTVCGAEGESLCRVCKRSLPAALQVCPVCTGSSIYGLRHEYHPETGLDGLLAIFDYKSEAVKKVVEGVKFGFNRELIDLCLTGWRTPAAWKGSILVPIPLHRYRENWRGFNQAEEIARKLASGKVEVVKALKRVRSTSQQARSMNKGMRAKNVRGAFELVPGSRLAGKKVVLVDDVFTSGATMNECARVLRLAGVDQIYGFVLAR